MSESKGIIEELYGFKEREEEDVKKRVAYLLDNDRFQCHPSKYDVRGNPFSRSENHLTNSLMSDVWVSILCAGNRTVTLSEMVSA